MQSGIDTPPRRSYAGAMTRAPRHCPKCDVLLTEECSVYDDTGEMVVVYWPCGCVDNGFRVAGDTMTVLNLHYCATCDKLVPEVSLENCDAFVRHMVCKCPRPVAVKTASFITKCEKCEVISRSNVVFIDDAGVESMTCATCGHVNQMLMKPESPTP